ncbi:MAG TPA: hypothetical protein VIG24_07050 [Acidimicrobiia bacterium]
MTTATAPRIISSETSNYAIIADNRVSVVAFEHDYEPRHSMSVSMHGDDNRVAISASDPTAHATFFMSREEARLFAQAILDATA